MTDNICMKITHNWEKMNAIIKFIITIMVTILLQVLCKSGLDVISWIIVFIPFIFMTVIVSLMLYTFGLNSITGSLNYTCINKPQPQPQ